MRSQDISSATATKLALVFTGLLSGYLIYTIMGAKSAATPAVQPKKRRSSRRPRAAGGGNRRAVYTMAAEESLDVLNDIPTEVLPLPPEVANADTWAVEESENLLGLILAIAEEQTMSDTIIHRSVTCNHCEISPVRGWRYKCANCVDYDLCSSCEALDVHFKTHTFIKIRIPIPPQANPKSMIFPPFYPGIPWTDTITFDTSRLESETHFDSMEIMGFYDQFKSLSTVNSEEGGITKDTFEKCLGTLKKESHLIVDRVFSFFDKDGDGIISFENMVRGLSVLCKGTMEERIRYAFHGYDINGDGFISRDELRRMFKSYFLLSMDLVRGVVKVMEEGMLDSFDDEAEKPVSAAFGAPSTMPDESGSLHPAAASKEAEETALDEGLSPSLDHSATRPAAPPLAIPSLAEDDQSNRPSNSSTNSATRRKLSYDPSSPVSLDLRPSLPFISDEEHVTIMESISHDAIEEMVEQVFAVAHAQDRDLLSFEDFTLVVEHDPNVLAW
ncbi:hypothetical protein HDV03_000249 [Kappamyces sp. JEL0829]|nr:hypothetical protein HDV03_000249 [Kappamyces sp. JEL0829]